MKSIAPGLVWAMAALVGAAGTLDHVVPLTDTVPVEAARLAPCEAVGFEVAEVIPIARAERLDAAVVADNGFVGLADVVTLAALPTYASLGVADGLLTADAAAYAMIPGSALALHVSPLLAPVEVWGEGPLGVLAREALAALDAGDVSGYLVKAADYWIGMDQALKRREVHQRDGVER